MRLQIKQALFAAVLVCAVGASSAQACNLGMKMLHTPGAAMVALSKSVNVADEAPPHQATAVGLWESTFTGQDGSTYVGFESIYADGNELLIDNSAPATDNVCSGVWEQTGPRTYTINHPSWDFDASGNLIGIVVLTETIVVDPKGNKYTGTGTVTVYDPSLSTIVYQVSGTLTAARITTRSKPL